MPKIDNASNLKLSELVNRLNLDDATHGAQELRSKGTDLYVKTGKAFFSSETSRASHRRDAVALVRDGLAKEYNTTKADADRILVNVFGYAPTQISGADVKRLNALGTVAAGLVRGGTTSVDAFEIARHAETLKGRGLGDAEALSAARLVNTLVQSGRSEADVINGVVTGRSLVEGGLTPGEAKAQLDSTDTRHAFFETLKDAMAGLPEYSASNGTQKETWLNIAKTLGTANFVPASKAQTIPNGYKASLLQALSDRVLDRAGAGDVGGTREAYLSVIQFNKAFTLAEIMPSSEGVKLDHFLETAGKDKTLRDARVNWDKMSTAERTKAIQTLIDLHANEFGYAVPKDFLHVGAMGPDEAGGLSSDGNKLQINSTVADFNNFAKVFDTVVHESTHKYQHKLVEDLNSGVIGQGHALYDQARIMKANNSAGVFENLLVNRLGVSADVAEAGYRHQPCEEHAYYVGNTAQSKIAQIFV
ncbi:MAG: hypothetical protein H6R18_391 [Proteobacteria bacterium]|nr:hypothetical protein [Pseudomonadota bacterium]